MVIVKEKEQFDEMARVKVASSLDNLPFDVVVQTHEHPPPHAVLLEKNSDTREKGEFLIPSRPPKFAADIQDFRKGISGNDREILFHWINQKNKIMPKLTNWEVLTLLWGLVVNR